jgi:hydroxyethylthiazole kinase-like uncharacterized protein yjeF
MGKALLICGSQGMAGAAILAAGGCLRGGVGYALMAVPGAIATEISISRPEAVLRLQGGLERKQIEAADISNLQLAAAEADAVAIGPGIGFQEGTTQTWITDFLSQQASRDPQQPLILDADALNQVAYARLDLKSFGLQNLALTPHPGEAARLIHAIRQNTNHSITPATPAPGPAQVQAERQNCLQELVTATGATVLLKGPQTLVGSPHQTSWQNSTGNAGMATAGSGDVLTGLICCLAARGLPIFEATRLGAYLHGLAGDFAAKKLGLESLVASDLVDYLPQAMQFHQAAQ